ncbi:MAG TPA: hypothetical protein VHU41_10650 [Thermoanaerobaculia bacterium]|nr:hypothetical protein [Thermoanaerobaculia bacterium]
MKGLVFVVIALLLAFAAFAATSGHDARSGVWTAEIYDGTKVNLSIFTGRSENHWGNNMSGVTLALPQLQGLTTADGPSKFTLRAPAGTIAFDGSFDALKGAGHFTFAPGEAFIRDMESLGYTEFRDDELLTFTTTGFSPESIRGLRSMGYDISRRELDEIAVFHITPDAIHEYARAGYPNLTMKEVINFRVGHVTPEYIAQMRQLGYPSMPARELGEMAVIGVKPDYVRELRGAGLTNLTARELTDLKIGRITAKKIDDYRALGYEHLTSRQLSEMGIMNVTADYIRQMQAVGVTDLHKLIELKTTGAADILLKKSKN